MARRNGRKGNYLGVDDYDGVTRYWSELKRDFWGNYSKNPVARNLQEIATPLNDPYPVPLYRGPQYEQTDPCALENVPAFIGTTTIPTPYQVNAPVSAQNFIPEMSIGCSFIVF